jgi:predicted  nucleic acid-binding Zn-ribbon protein
MLKRIDYKNQPKPILLTKGQTNYNKLQKEMNEAPKEYNAIKSLIENNENSIEKISNNIQSKFKYISYG